LPPIAPTFRTNDKPHQASFLDDCKYEGWSTPFENCARSQAVLDEMPKKERKAVIAVPLEWAQALLDCTDVPFIRRIKYAVAFTSRLTDGEICGLNVEDARLDDELPVFTINRACQAKAKDGWARPGRTKNDYRMRTLPMHSTAKQALRIWLDHGYEIWAGKKPEPGKPLFPGLDGDYSRTDAAVHIRQDLRAAGLPDKIDDRNVDFHATRRSCATWLEELGANDLHRKRLMGHAIKDVTDTNYTRKTRELMVQLRETVELIPLRWSSSLVRVFGAAAPSAPNSSMDSAPPTRLERMTFGLGTAFLSAGVVQAWNH
jgi:integrase